mgnify:CR=1 FL=1
MFLGSSTTAPPGALLGSNLQGKRRLVVVCWWWMRIVGEARRHQPDHTVFLLVRFNNKPGCLKRDYGKDMGHAR